jgi:hypothetical protein
MTRTHERLAGRWSRVVRAATDWWAWPAWVPRVLRRGLRRQTGQDRHHQGERAMHP